MYVYYHNYNVLVPSMTSSYDFTEPRLEKRILPLLDVALTVMGMLLVLLVTASMEEQSEGEEAGLIIAVDKNGTFKLNDAVLAQGNQVNETVLQKLCDEALKRDPPSVTIVFPPLGGKLKNSDSSYRKILNQLRESGIDVDYSENKPKD